MRIRLGLGGAVGSFCAGALWGRRKRRERRRRGCQNGRGLRFAKLERGARVLKWGREILIFVGMSHSVAFCRICAKARWRWRNGANGAVRWDIRTSPFLSEGIVSNIVRTVQVKVWSFGIFE